MVSRFGTRASRRVSRSRWTACTRCAAPSRASLGVRLAGVVPVPGELDDLQVVERGDVCERGEGVRPQPPDLLRGDECGEGVRPQPLDLLQGAFRPHSVGVDMKGHIVVPDNARREQTRAPSEPPEPGLHGIAEVPADLQVADLIQPVHHDERVSLAHEVEEVLPWQVFPDRLGEEGVEQPVPGDPAGEPEVPQDEWDGDAVAEQGFPRVLMRVGQLPGEPIDQRRLAAAGIAQDHQVVMLRDCLSERPTVAPRLRSTLRGEGLHAHLRLDEEPVNPHVLVVLERRQAEEPDRPVGGPDGGQVVPHLFPFMLPVLPA